MHATDLPQNAPRWLSVLLPCTAVLLVSTVAVFAVVDRPVISTDPAFYQHAGWYVTRGATPYVDFWDVNPPLTFAVTAVLALVAGGDPAVLHALSVSLTVVAVAAAVLSTAWLADALTGDDAAALGAGFAMLLLPEVYGLPPLGVRSQYFALLFGVLGLVLAVRHQPAAAGASVAAGAAFWQPGAGLAPLVVGMALRRDGRRGAVAAVGGGGLVAALVVLPFALAGALVPMAVQTVVAPLHGHAPFTLLSRTYAVALALGYGAAVLPVALYGWYRAARGDRDRWWVPAGALVYSLQLLVVNMNGALDMLLWLVFAAMGVAVAVEALPARRRWTVVAFVALLVLTGPVWNLAPGAPLHATLQAEHERALPDVVPPNAELQTSVPDVRTIYWQQIRPETCHYRLSWTELRWIASTDARPGAEQCGQWLDPAEVGRLVLSLSFAPGPSAVAPATP